MAFVLPAELGRAVIADQIAGLVYSFSFFDQFLGSRLIISALQDRYTFIARFEDVVNSCFLVANEHLDCEVVPDGLSTT